MRKFVAIYDIPGREGKTFSVIQADSRDHAMAVAILAAEIAGVTGDFDTIVTVREIDAGEIEHKAAKVRSARLLRESGRG